ncbi:DHA1 family bicyclomycin/chloramphenicol resistance-like MFS transporter [Tamaricihabitans halophyticus]|uniref:DHA1 family bicyclomycin/chloramphenicol resistance-like MFS transporter n=1 Tax=Tamaricihabitans halophyticus TaxID=1262583 RepID=A0A4R2QN26_9PSEU|nr:multidrug effflux MFS transporter [Tamaricihabitans halophyticus]TCP48455.1 DHA1 family bicyclomycin/chloramphenicol resistance-like MFS transporter [Tamaricihabitans halophyticus]
MDKTAARDPGAVTAPVGSPELAEPSGARRIRLILVLGALVALGPLTIDMYLPALPAIRDDLLASDAGVQLTLTGTLLGLGFGQLVIGPFSDAVGRRVPLIAGTALHIASSLLCLLAPNIVVLGGLRVLQGIGTAATAVVALAVVRDTFSGRSAATALSRLMLVMGVAPILAPTVGGAVLRYTSWRGVFGVLAVLGVVLLVVGFFALKETLPPEKRRSGEIRPVLRTYRSLITDWEFVALALTAAMAMSALFSYVSGSSFVLQEQFGLGEQQFAIVFGLGAVSIILASQLNVVLLNRYSPKQIVFTALLAATGFGAALVVVAVLEIGGLVGFMVPLWLMLGAVGFVMPNAPALALSRHGEAAGTAAGMLGTGQFGLGALFAPLIGLFGNDGPALAIAMTAGVVIAVCLLGSVVRGQRQAVLA